MDERAAQLQVRVLHRARQQDRARLGEYAGIYNFGHNADNPLSTGNGYANALLGNFTTYTELNNRIDEENRHWQSDAYAQDSWRINPRVTLDYGIRVTHHGAMYEVAET